jgi:hypothetical protein
MPTRGYNIRVVLKSENGYWIVQGLEYDIAAQGKDIAKAKESFVKTIVGHLTFAAQRGIAPFQGVNKAPRVYWNAFEKGEQLQNPIQIPSSSFKRLRNRIPEMALLPASFEARVA